MTAPVQAFDIAIIGGGIVGLSTAMNIARRNTFSILLLEAENRLGSHQTGHNSGVIHSGLYYKPGSLKAKNCVLGRERLYNFCREEGIEFKRCGKIVVAASEDELYRLRNLEARGRANGLHGIRRLGSGDIKEYEPYAGGIEALHVPDTGIVNFQNVSERYSTIAMEFGARIETCAEVRSVSVGPREFMLITDRAEFKAHCIINCAGLYSDRIARMCGLEPGLRIIPFRGEFYKLLPEKEYLVRNMIYPVPDPRFPFLGVHFTVTVDGSVKIGPTSMPAFWRENYNGIDNFNTSEILNILTWEARLFLSNKFGFRTLAVDEIKKYNRKYFTSLARGMVNKMDENGFTQWGAPGIRAQLLNVKTMEMVMDFVVEGDKESVHILNAVSPAFTCSTTFTKWVVGNRGIDLFRL